jgi:hypothetical protein
MTATTGRDGDAGLAVETRTQKGDPAQRIVMYDPGSFLPYYVDQLCRHLANAGSRIGLSLRHPSSSRSTPAISIMWTRSSFRSFGDSETPCCVAT